MAGFHVGQYACIGSLDIDGAPAFPLNCPAWDVINLDVLWTGEAVRGENTPLPRITGQRGYPRRLDQAEYNLIIGVRGDVHPDGTPITTQWQGHVDHLDALWATACAPVGTGDGPRACTLALPDGVTTRTANVQFEPLQQQGELEDPNAGIYTFRVVIPDGRFT